MNTTNNQLVIVELSPPFERLELQFVPREVRNPRTPNLNPVQVIGRNDDIYHYSGGRETLSFQLEFFSDEEGRADVYRKVEWLKSLTINNGYLQGYRNVKLVWGKMFKDMVFVVTNVDPKLSGFDDQNDWLPLRALVDISFNLDPKSNQTLQQYRNRIVVPDQFTNSIPTSIPESKVDNASFQNMKDVGVVNQQATIPSQQAVPYSNPLGYGEETKVDGANFGAETKVLGA